MPKKKVRGDEEVMRLQREVETLKKEIEVSHGVAHKLGEEIATFREATVRDAEYRVKEDERWRKDYDALVQFAADQRAGLRLVRSVFANTKTPHTPEEMQKAYDTLAKAELSPDLADAVNVLIGLINAAHDRGTRVTTMLDVLMAVEAPPLRTESPWVKSLLSTVLLGAAVPVAHWMYARSKKKKD